MNLKRKEFNTPEELREFTQKNLNIRVTGTFQEGNKLVINFFEVNK